VTEIIIDFSNYKLYSRATKSGGAVVKSSGSGGGTVATSSSGGGGTHTSSSGGSTQTTSGFSKPTFFVYSSTKLPLTGATFDNHTHAVEVTDELDHSHSVSIPAHSHNVTVPNHSHNVTVPAHSHDIDIPEHSHDIEHGIFTLDRLPTAVTIKVDGNTIPHTAINGDNIDLVPYLEKAADGRIKRGAWHKVEILPNDLGRIVAQINMKCFIQSRGQYTL